MYNKLMKTPSMIEEPSTILLQPHVGTLQGKRKKKTFKGKKKRNRTH